jgi:hypothetical protein
MMISIMTTITTTARSSIYEGPAAEISLLRPLRHFPSQAAHRKR